MISLRDFVGCLLGYLLGDSLIALLVLCPDLLQDIQEAKEQLKPAVFICGITLQSREGLKNGNLRMLALDKIFKYMKLTIPTIHWYNYEDGEHSADSQVLEETCWVVMRVRLLNSSGYSMPKQPPEIG